MLEPGPAGVRRGSSRGSHDQLPQVGPPAAPRGTDRLAVAARSARRRRHPGHRAAGDVAAARGRRGVAGAAARADARAQRLPRQGRCRSAASTRSARLRSACARCRPSPRDRIVLPERALERIERHTAGLAAPSRPAARERPPRAARAAPPRPARDRQDALGDVPRRPDAGAHGDPAHGPRRSAPSAMACSLARSLEPAMVVIEDVDLIAARTAATYESDAAAVRAAQRDGRPRRGRRPDLRAHDEPGRVARGGARLAARADRPRRRAAAARRAGAAPAVRALRRGPRARGRRLGAGRGGDRRDEPRVHPRAVPACRPGRGRGRARGGRGRRPARRP